MTHEDIFNKYVEVALQYRANGNHVGMNEVLSEMRAFVVQNHELGLIDRARALMSDFPELVASLH